MIESILKRFPDLKQDDIILRDDGDGIYIDVWNSDEPKPTIEQVYAWIDEDRNGPKQLSEIEELKKNQIDLMYELMLAGVI